MATTTRVAAVQDALKTLIDADSTLNTAVVSLGTPVNPTRDAVWISGEVTDWTQEVAITGTSAAGGNRQESFTLRVFCASTKTADNYTGPRDRAIALAQALDTLVNQNPTISGTCFYADITARQMHEGVADADRVVMVEVSIRVTAYLTGA